jgi:hypothetical protein
MLFFLQLRHWQVFMLVFGVFLIPFAVRYAAYSFGEHEIAYTVLGGAPYVGTFCLLASNLWFYSIGLELRKRLPSDHSPFNLTFFRLCLIVPFANWLLSFVNWELPDEVVFSLDAGSIIGNLLVDFILAKALVAVETNQKVIFGNAVGTFFQFLVYPLGVWTLQPRLNTIAEAEAGSGTKEGAPLDHHLT